MGFEELKVDSEEERYSNEDYARKVLEDGGEGDLSRLRRFQGWSEEETERYCHFSRLRRATLDNMRIDLERRKEDNPEPTAEELSLGAYTEQIEPQVREAVLSLRRKGYPTCYSGFSGFGNKQTVRLEEGNLEGLDAKELIGSFADRGILLSISSDEIEMTFDKEANLPEITEFWREISEAAPDQGHPAPDCRLGSAKNFRKRFNKT